MSRCAIRLSIGTVLLATCFLSCRKDAYVPEAGNDVQNRGLRQEVEKNDYEIGIIDNAMWGSFSKYSEGDIYFSGATWPESAISLRIGEETYHPYGNGQWFQGYKPILKSYFGKQLPVEFRQGENLVQKTTMFVPLPHMGKLISRNMTPDGKIGKVGTSMTFSGSETNQVIVLVRYYVKDQDGKSIALGYKFLKSNETLELDELIQSPEAYSISLSINSGNGTMVTVNGKRIYFCIKVVDHHEYRIAS